MIAEKLKSHMFVGKYVEFVNQTIRSTNPSNTPNQFICYRLKSALFREDDLQMTTAYYKEVERDMVISIC